MSEEPTEAHVEVGSPAGSADTGMASTLDAQSGRRSNSTSESRKPLREGDVLGGRYRIVERIGAGGMGTVYLAEHTKIGKPVAVKVLDEEYGRRSRLAERFLQEARAASSIRHEHIVDITDFGDAHEDRPFIAMEYLEGETLAQCLRREGPLPWPRARRIFLQICAALQAAHDKGVVHRDIKPDNVFLVRRGDQADHVKVLDFGIAKILTEDTDQGLTQTGAVIGTAAYMSPEQAQSLEVDPRTDVYSAGVILYEMLTGRVPFRAEGFMGVLAKHLTERPPNPRSVAPAARIPVALERVVLRALRKQRDERYGSAQEMAAALESVGDGGRSGGGWIVALGALAAAGLVLMLWPKGSAEPEPAASAEGKTAAAPSPEGEPAVARRAVAAMPRASSSGEAEVNDAGATTGVVEAIVGTGADPSTSGADEAGATEAEAEAETTSAEDSVADGEDAPPPRPPATTHSRPPSTTRAPTRERLDSRDIGRGLSKARKHLDACGKKHAPFGSVRVKVTFRIEPDGKVSSAEAHPPYRGFPLGHCVEGALRAVGFPKAREGTEATREIVVGG